LRISKRPLIVTSSEPMGMSESPPKKIKSPRYQREDAAWGRSKTYELIKFGDLQTVRIAGRQYVVMASHERLITPAAE